MRPILVVRAPPIRPIVRSVRRRAARTAWRASTPSTNASGIAQPASISVKRVYRVTATAAGSVAHDRRPSRTAAQARPFLRLLLRVGTANRCRWDRTADNACDGDDRDDVRERAEEDRRRLPGRYRRELEGEGRREAEEERGAEGPERAPLAEDQ